MDNRIVGLLGAVLVAGALAGVPDTAGAAAPDRCPYTGCIDTVTVATGPAKLVVRDKPSVTFKVKANGNAEPSGFVRVSIEPRSGNGKAQSFVVDYAGGRRHIDGKRLLEKGTYEVAATFIPDSSGPYNDSADRYGMRVTQAKKNKGR